MEVEVEEVEDFVKGLLAEQVEQEVLELIIQFQQLLEFQLQQQHIQ